MTASQTSTHVLTSQDIERIILHVGIHPIMDALISGLEQAIFSFDPQQIEIPVRSGFHYQAPTMGLVEWMPLHQQGKQVVIKVVGYHPDNPKQKDLPTILSSISAYDTATGHLIGLVDGVLLTALRTGAASAVASKYLAHPESRALGLIGCGAQSITQLHALSRVFSFEKVLFYDLDPSTMSSFPARTDLLNLAVDMQPTDIETIVRESDILCTATSIDVGAGPLFEGLPTQDHLHINAVGSDFPGKIELPAALLNKGFVSPDFRSQAIQEGECQQLEASQIGPDWVEVIQNAKQYQHIQEQLSIFDSTGWPLEDQVVMDLFLSYANKLGLGQMLNIEHESMDAKNPYHFTSESATIQNDAQLLIRE